MIDRIDALASVGVLLIVLGVFLWAIPAGLIVLGLALLTFSIMGAQSGRNS